VPSGKPFINPEILNPSTFFLVIGLFVAGDTFPVEVDFLIV
jgi:hypothetical protein